MNKYELKDDMGTLCYDLKKNTHTHTIGEGGKHSVTFLGNCIDMIMSSSIAHTVNGIQHLLQHSSFKIQSNKICCYITWY